DLPQPDGPTRQTNSPCCTSRLTRSRTWTGGSPRLPGKIMLRSRRRTAGPPEAGPFTSGPLADSGMGSPMGVAPADLVEVLQLADQQVEDQADDADDGHAGHDEVV